MVELAIVLVVIGLLAAGILVGLDLIESARRRALIGEVEKIDTAVNVFRLKYNCLPGDCAAAPATQAGFAHAAAPCNYGTALPDGYIGLGANEGG